MPLISVVIPAYNGASRYLEQAIGSVLAQTFPDRELIVVDDASTDETSRIVLRFPQARYFRRAENGGQAAARNDGARRAQGTYLAFLDQDDLWEPILLQETLAVLEAHPEAAAVHCDGYQVNGGNRILEYDGAMKHRASITQMLRGGHDVATSGCLFRKTCFDAVGGYDEHLTIWEDIDLAIRLYQRFRILHLAKPLYRHRLYDHNASRDIPSQRALLARERFLGKHGPFCKPGSAEKRALARDWSAYYADLGKSLQWEGRVDEARRAFWLSVRHQPFNRKAILRLFRSYLVRPSSIRQTPSQQQP
ncbi:MAG TPA: glycosyltransferase [Nitrospiraceae bacterium]|jgi:glycosyltransferase involved in cell wall biosynthesis|nr:glycosyltransferase [Nitrospiraceae bacterium]